MGELSPEIGKKLENFGSILFENLGWELITQNLSVNCTRSTHKSPTSKSGDKKTHGIDLLKGFYNPFTTQKESVIISCKNHKWKDFIPSNLNQWIEELLNTIECTSASPVTAPYIAETTLMTGILLFNSSDNLYDVNRAQTTLSQVIVPKRRAPIMLYIADTGMLEKWFALNKEISKIKDTYANHNFGVVYPSVGGSHWDRKSLITPSCLFSDYIFTVYTKTEEHKDGSNKVDVKAVFCFDSVSEDSMLYLLDMMNSLQLEARSERKQEIHIYFFPEDSVDNKRINDFFAKTISKNKPDFQIKFLDNRRLSPVV